MNEWTNLNKRTNERMKEGTKEYVHRWWWDMMSTNHSSCRCHSQDILHRSRRGALDFWREGPTGTLACLDTCSRSTEFQDDHLGRWWGCLGNLWSILPIAALRWSFELGSTWGNVPFWTQAFLEEGVTWDHWRMGKRSIGLGYFN